MSIFDNDSDHHGHSKEDFFRVLLDLLSPLRVKQLEKKGSSQSTLEKMTKMMNE